MDAKDSTKKGVVLVPRIPAKTEDFLAAQLHEARVKLAAVKAELLEKNRLLLQRDQRLLQLENEKVDAENEKLREQHGLALGRTIHKDDETGEIYWLNTGADAAS